MLAHNVYFTLKDRSDLSKATLIAACKKYLTHQPGVLFFACGTLTPELTRSVNDREFDVSLHVVFDTLASHDAYQDVAPHHQFIAENNHNWASVRVFDSNVEGE